MFYFMLIHSTQHRRVAWVAKCKSLQQHWHISSRATWIYQVQTVENTHACYFWSIFVFKYILIFFFSVPLVSRKTKRINQSKPYSAEWEPIRRSTERKQVKRRYRADGWNQRFGENFVFFFLFFCFCWFNFNIEHIRHASTTSTSTPFSRISGHQIQVGYNTGHHRTPTKYWRGPGVCACSSGTHMTGNAFIKGQEQQKALKDASFFRGVAGLCEYDPLKNLIYTNDLDSQTTNLRKQNARCLFFFSFLL